MIDYSQRPKLTLHRAMAQILLEQPARAATTTFLAQQVYSQELYWKKSGEQPTQRQIYLRAKNYPHLFITSDDQKSVRLIDS